MKVVKNPLPNSPEILKIKADARDHARNNLKKENAYGFELLIDEMLMIQYQRENVLKPNNRCPDCFGRGQIRKLIKPGSDQKIKENQETVNHPCTCIQKQYYKRKPEHEVILPAGEYGKPLEPVAKVPEVKAKPTRKKPISSRDQSPKGKPKKAGTVRKNKSSISDKGKD